MCLLWMYFIICKMIKTAATTVRSVGLSEGSLGWPINPLLMEKPIENSVGSKWPCSLEKSLYAEAAGPGPGNYT